MFEKFNDDQLSLIAEALTQHGEKTVRDPTLFGSIAVLLMGIANEMMQRVIKDAK